jgi:hypothetical protein
MPEPPCSTQMLEALRRKALLHAAQADDPLTRQQYVDLAQAYADTAIELRESGVAILPEFVTDHMQWRSIPLRVPNDR